MIVRNLAVAVALAACGPHRAADPPAPPAAADGDAGASGLVFVAVGPMGSNAGGGDALLAEMRLAAEGALVLDPMFLAVEPDAEPDTGYLVDATLTRLSTRGRRRRVTVSCTISMLVTTRPERRMLGIQEGSTEVTSTEAAADVDAAKLDCVRAVVADLVAGSVIPMMRRASGLDR